MSEHFADRLIDAIQATGSAGCVGIDPRPGWDPTDVAPAGGPPWDYAAELIRLASGRVPAVKPQLAFLDDDAPGVRRLGRSAQAQGLLVVADAKRGDIGSTAEAYARTWLAPGSGADALTVNPYLGADALEPFVAEAARAGKGLFVLVRTSNPGARDLQELELRTGERVFERVARLVDDLGRAHVGACGFSCVGAVVGATAPPEQVARLRELMPRALFLMPGLGAQGGDLRGVARALDRRGLGVLAPSSRGTAYPWRGKGDAGDVPAPPDWRARVTAAIDALNADLARARGSGRA